MSTYSVAYVSPITNTLFLNTSQLQRNSNTLTTAIGTQFSGDLVLSNGTSNKIVFNPNGSGDPAVSNRSLGTKLVLSAGVTSTNLDVALGVNSTSLWLSVPQATDNFKFWNGSTASYVFTQYGINTLTAATVSRTVDTLTGATANLVTNGDIVLNNASANTILFAAAGSGAPTLTPRSVGTKLVLRPNITSGLDSAIGTTNNTIWFTTPTSGAHQFYVGTLSPIFTVSASTVACLATTSTGSSNTAVGALTVGGDAVVAGGLYLTNSSGGLPLFNARSAGSRIVFQTNVGGSSTDTAIGYKGPASGATGGLYFGLGTSQSVDIYNNTTKIAQIGPVVQIMDTTGTTLIQINPSKEDVLSPIKDVFAAPVINTPTAIPGLKFTNGVTRAFDAVVIADQLVMSTHMYERHDIQAVQVSAGTWDYTDESLGDDIAIDFSVDNTGQVFFSVPSTCDSLSLSFTAKTIPII